MQLSAPKGMLSLPGQRALNVGKGQGSRYLYHIPCVTSHTGDILDTLTSNKSLHNSYMLLTFLTSAYKGGEKLLAHSGSVQILLTFMLA